MVRAGIRQPVGWWIAAAVIVAAAAALSSPVGAQQPVAAVPPPPGMSATALAQAAATITAAEVARHVAALTADSLRSGATPSPALEQTAAYLARQFRQLGLRARDTMIWHYPVPGQLLLDDARSSVLVTRSVAHGNQVVLTETGDTITQTVALTFAPAPPASDAPRQGQERTVAAAAYFAPEVGPPAVAQMVVRSFDDAVRDGSMQVIVLAGPQTAASIPEAAVRDQVVIYVPPTGVDSTTRQQILRRLYALSAGVLLVSEADAVHFAAAGQRARQQRVPLVESYMREAAGVHRWPWAVVVQPDVMADLLRATTGLELATLRTAAAPLLRPVPRTQIWLDPQPDSLRPRLTAPVVEAVLEGTDSFLASQGYYFIITASMDGPGHPDSLGRRTDDQASGMAGLLALAQAFRQSGVRPRYSLLFLATSGSAAGQAAWGSSAYVDPFEGHSPFVDRLVGVLDLDRIGHLAGDSLLLDGLADVELAQRPVWLAAAHPELGVTVADGGTVVVPGSTLFPFIRRGVPSLAVHGGMPAEPAAGAGARPAAAAAGAVTAEQTARILQYVFYLIESVGNAERRPQWTATGRRRFAAVEP